MTVVGKNIDINSNVVNESRYDSEDGWGYTEALSSVIAITIDGKPIVVVVQSQIGDPICAFIGNDVYWDVCEDLPKTTKLMIDGKALYIHSATSRLLIHYRTKIKDVLYEDNQRI